MPHYDYRCTHCGDLATLRRLISELDEPVESLCCGAEMRLQFSPNANIFVPLHFRQWGTGGTEGGGQLSWSSFHDETERELARDPRFEKSERLFSQPGHGRG